jgi:hypothetical protein
MKKPETYKELCKLVHPLDLIKVLKFNGINASQNQEHYKLSQKYWGKILDTITRESWDGERTYQRWKEPRYFREKLGEEFYRTLILCIQDFYYWGHQFNHSFGHIYYRVVNALEIPIDKITPIMDKVKRGK